MPLLAQGVLSILKNSAATILVRGASGIARIAILLLIARTYGAAEFGQVTLALSLIEILKVCADAGVDITSIRRFAADPEHRERFFNNILTFKLTAGTTLALVAPFVYIAILGHTGGLTTLLALLPSMLTGLFFTGFVGYFQSQLRVAELIRGNVIGVFVFVALAIAAMIVKVPLAWVVMAMPVGELISVLVFAKIYRRYHALRFDRDWSALKILLGESLPVGVGGILVIIYLRLDNVMIGWFLGESEVGHYAFAFRLMEPFSLVFSSLAISLYASLSSRWNTPEEVENKKTIVNVIALVLGMASLGFAGTVVLRELIPALAPAYSASADILLLMGLTLFVKGINPQLTAILNSLGKFRIIMHITAANLCIALGLNLILVPRYAIVGAALSVLIMETSNTLMQALALAYYRSLPSKKRT
jgi:O-antigen/teichoic acid export membrane protein